MLVTTGDCKTNASTPDNLSEHDALARIWNDTYKMRCKAIELVVKARGVGLESSAFKTEVNKMYNYLLTGKYE